MWAVAAGQALQVQGAGGAAWHGLGKGGDAGFAQAHAGPASADVAKAGNFQAQAKHVWHWKDIAPLQVEALRNLCAGAVPG